MATPTPTPPQNEQAFVDELTETLTKWSGLLGVVNPLLGQLVTLGTAAVDYYKARGINTGPLEALLASILGTARAMVNNHEDYLARHTSPSP